MTDDTEILLKVYEQQWVFARQAEDQRAQITNMVLLIASVVIGFVAQSGSSPGVLPLTILLIALGLYGAVISEKYYERIGFFRARVDVLEKEFEKMHPGIEIAKLWQEANEVNTKEFPRLKKLRLHYLWVVVHSGIAIAGIILTLFIVLARRA